MERFFLGRCWDGFPAIAAARGYPAWGGALALPEEQGLGSVAELGWGGCFNPDVIRAKRGIAGQLVTLLLDLSRFGLNSTGENKKSIKTCVNGLTLRALSPYFLI